MCVACVVCACVVIKKNAFYNQIQFSHFNTLICYWFTSPTRQADNKLEELKFNLKFSSQFFDYWNSFVPIHICKAETNRILKLDSTGAPFGNG